MEKLDPRTDGASPDIVEENVEELKRLFPEIVTEGKVDFDALHEVLGDYTDEREERYSFTWNGKSRARRLAQTPSTGTLRPCPEESVNWDTTQNLFIEGENLEVLKLLQKSYHRKIKLIYIDPPYNTGNDFIYPDNFRDSIANYLAITGQADEEGKKLTTNPETSGRYHTDWLNMVYPRLRLARNLLRADGVLLVSIDDHEAHNLRKLCDEVFGEENRVGTIVWKNATDNNPSRVVTEHEYIHVYARNIGALEPVWRTKISDIKERLAEIARQFIEKYPGQDERQAQYSIWFRENKPYLWPLDRYKYIDEHGIYTGSQSVHNPGREGYRYDVFHPYTGKPCKQPLMGYRFPPETMDRLLAEEKVLFGDDESKIIELKVYTEEFSDKLSSLVGLDGRLGAYDLRELFPEHSKLFTNPKPVRLLIQLMSYIVEGSDIVLDFFAGSCASAHAVLEMNARDCGLRRFAMIQLPELIDAASETGRNALAAGFTTIAEVGKERIRRVVSRLQAESAERDQKRETSLLGSDGLKEHSNLGFRVLKLSTSNIKAWDAELEEVEGALLSSVENVKADRSEADVLYELLLKFGLDLAVPMEKREIAGRAVHVIGAGALIVCLADQIDIEVVEGIASLKEELAPETIRVVFKDAGFADDVVKTNAVQILHQAGIDDVRSL